jgi:Uma2 family endonuclease
MTLEAFLAWEDAQPLRYEFDGFQVRAMTGGTAGHSRIQRNLLAALGSRLRGGPCEVFGSELKIVVADSVRYPDLFVICSRAPDKATYVTDPVAVFEVIGPSTAGVDRIVKAREYGATPSIQRYVILEQDGQAATVSGREHDGWDARVIEGDVELAMPEIGISVPLAELYEGVVLVPYE